jgi:dienelactone hydrolase
MKYVDKKWLTDILLAWFSGALSLGFLMFCFFGLLATFVGSAALNAFLVWELSGMERSIRQPTSTPAAVVLAPPTITSLPPLTPTLPPTTTPTPTATFILGPPTPTPHPLAAYTVEELRVRSYPGGLIQVRSVLTETDVFTRYYIDYPSDGLTITGIMQVPRGDGPFPVIILNHGYIPRDLYWSGADTSSAAGYLNRQGYLTIAPDFRSWGASDTGNSFFSTGQVIDVLNLISSLPSLPNADLTRIGMWGHSMGGGITMKAITIDSRIKAAVLYAPVSANDAEVLARWGPGCRPDQPSSLVNKCGGAEILVSDIDEDLFGAYMDAVQNPGLLYQTSAINYVDLIIAPVQIHIGTTDTNTPPEWSATINEALRMAGKEVEYFTYPGQGHLLRGESWQLFMARVVDFFDRNLLSLG